MTSNSGDGASLTMQTPYCSSWASKRK